MTEVTQTALSGRPGQNLAQQLVEVLMADIRSGSLMPGMKMPSESTLMARFSVSRTVVREAVSRLQAAGLVESHQGKGSFVLMVPHQHGEGMAISTVNTPEDVTELIGFRLGVEVEGAGLAAAGRSDDEAASLTRAAAAMRNMPAQTSQMLEADFNFHRQIAQATGNRFYGELLDSLGPAMIAYPAYRLQPLDQAGNLGPDEVICREHEAIAEAIVDGDIDAARAAMRLHLSNTRNRLSRKK
ncbi:GntR family transcriptional regulator [Paenarthrobacter nitroguajacolicus]|uniref:FadR/GntR family transcriptional regulator n=1 Tax=Paenarthrobacter nitroguajacolicus TaxID=211146 RepID=UPI0015B7D138|nr:FadR/GntR family transcriptional regulator [Paenarthrobacter nitroguajacolicus]NWL10314.1 GntR family transcriptional regulator [Paenarthrobacter nitroguajacolicus]